MVFTALKALLMQKSRGRYQKTFVMGEATGGGDPSPLERRHEWPRAARHDESE